MTMSGAAYPAEASVDEDTQGQHVWVPEPFGEAASFTELDLTLDSVDLVLISESLDGASRSEVSNDRLDVTLDSKVLFGIDSAELLPAARKQLSEVTEQLLARGVGKVEIVGHTDDLGSAAHGYDLSQRRADAVRKVLAPQLDGYDISTQGLGEDEPRVPNTSEKNRALNRRVEIRYTAQG